MRGGRVTRSALSMFERVFDRILEITGVLSGVLYAIIMFALCWEVISRRIFNAPTTWAVDLSTLSLYIASLIGMGWVLKQEGHVKIEIVVTLFSSKTQAVIGAITSAIGLAACIVVAWQGVLAVEDVYKTKAVLARSLEIPKMSYLWVFPLGFFIVSLQFVRRIRSFLRNVRSS